MTPLVATVECSIFGRSQLKKSTLRKTSCAAGEGSVRHLLAFYELNFLPIKDNVGVSVVNILIALAH